MAKISTSTAALLEQIERALAWEEGARAAIAWSLDQQGSLANPYLSEGETNE